MPAWRWEDLVSSNLFEDHSAVQEYAQTNDLEVVWKHSPPFRKWSRRLPPEQFEIREVLCTRKGPTHVGLFSKKFVRAEWRETQERHRPGAGPCMPNI
jgi:hypothetical protein